MVKRIFLLFYLGLLCFLLCAYVPAPPAVRPLVNQVDVYCSLDGEYTHMHLTESDQMESVLGCVRASESHVPVSAPILLKQEDSCLIRVGMTDGTYHVYRQHGTEYFSEHSGFWKQIPPAQGMRLLALLRTLKTQGFQGAFLFCANFFLLFPIDEKLLTKQPIIHPCVLYDMEYFI